MKQELGFSAAIAVAVAAAIGLTSQMNTGSPSAQGANSASRASEQVSEKNQTAASDFSRGACGEIESHIQSFLAVSDRDQIAAPTSCFVPPDTSSTGQKHAPRSNDSNVADSTAAGKIQAKASHLQFMIATLPDPAHTHFPLLFDRMTEALQQAASDEYYSYDSSWLPWSTQEDKYTRVQDQELAGSRRKAQEDQPGILLFRRSLSANPSEPGPDSRDLPYTEGLVIFLVGEEPTQGVHREQFRNATAWIAALLGKSESGHTLPSRILGPSFSGSVPSLASLIAEASNQAPSGFNGTSEDGPIQVYSGNVTGDRAMQWFTAETKSLNVSFASFQQSDHFLMSRYCEYLTRSSFDLSRLAILSEDQTAYGSEMVQLGKQLLTEPSRGSSAGTSKRMTRRVEAAALEKDTPELGLTKCNLGRKDWDEQSNAEPPLLGRPARLFYPRDISGLRTAYQNESIFSPRSSPTESAQRTLSSDIADPLGKQHDSIRSYAVDQTALSQEAVLQQIVSQLRVHQTEFIMLRSSNVLDQIFLSHYLRLAYPQGRIVILSSDQLLRRESGATRLSGIMTLTTYPLLPWEPHWTRLIDDPSAHSHRVFAQDRAEGAYIAARFLLHTPIRIVLGQERNAILREMREVGYSNQSGTFNKLECPGIHDSFQLAPGESNGAYAQAGACLVIQSKGAGSTLAPQVLVMFKDDKVSRIVNERLENVTVYTRPMLPVQGFAPVDAEIEIPDYRAPFWMDATRDTQQGPEQVPAWLSVLGRNDFWPLAALTQTTITSESLDKISGPPGVSSGFFHDLSRAGASLFGQLVHWRVKEYGHHEVQAPPRWPPMTLSMRVSMAMLALWGIFHFLCCYFPSVTKKPSHRAHFVCGAVDHRPYLTLMVLASVTLCSVATVLTWAFGGMSPDGQPLRNGELWPAFLPLFWLLAAASLIVNLWNQRPSFGVQSSDESSNNRASQANSDPTVPEPLSSDEHAEPPASAPHANAENGQVKSAPGQGSPKVPFHKQVAQNWPRIRKPLAFFVLGVLAFYFVCYFCTERALSVANRIPTYWRCMNLTSGVSPLVPLLAFGVGMYIWLWYSMQGLALLGQDRPCLPPLTALNGGSDPANPSEPGKLGDVLRMFSHEDAATPVEKLCSPFAPKALKVAASVFILFAIVTVFFATEVPFRSLGARSYSIFICLLMDGFVSVMLANAWQFLNIWLNLRQLLTHLDRLPLRRSMAAFPGVSWDSVWNISGNVLDLRYKLLTSELYSVTHLKNCLALRKPSFLSQDFWDEEFKKIDKTRFDLAQWYATFYGKSDGMDQTQLHGVQKLLAHFAGLLVAKMLIVEWRSETGEIVDTEHSEPAQQKRAKYVDVSTSLTGLDPYVRHAEQLVCYIYLGFIQNVMGRMRSLAMSILWMFIAVTVAMSSYPFDPRPAISGVIVLLFAVLSVVIVTVYAQMHRDPILSLVTKTNPGELGADFWFKLLGFGAGPVLGLLTTLFPQLTDFAFSWIQPGLSSIK